MFIYLSKKIAIPNNTKLNSLAWNREDGYIAVGGENGLLKVLKLDAAGGENETTNSRSRGLIASSNLSMNQTLEGHTENIQVITWNESHRKLTTSDQNGVIIVWMIYKNAWYEEMINNRKKSTVVGMAWSSDGLKICIIYEDGAVIVGSVDGNRIWGKELKGVMLSGVQWSPDGKFLLFTLFNGEVHLYDNQGNFMMRLDIQCILNEQVSVVGLDWYDGKYGYTHTSCPSLAICYENGKMQLMCNESDTDPIIVDTSITSVDCRWNHNGSLLAVAGYQLDDDNKTGNIVQFYNPFGDIVRTLKVPGKTISCCEWEGGSLRVALAVDSFVYFANIRPDYKWCYFKKVIVFTTGRPQKSGISVSFWDTTNNQCHTRFVPELIALAGYGDHCVLVIKTNDASDDGKYGLLLCNTLGTPIDGKYTDKEIQWVTMNSSHVIAASKDHFLLWQYRTPKLSNPSLNRTKYKIIHVDDTPSGAVEVIRDFNEMIEEQIESHSSANPICCLTASDKCLLIGRETGVLQHYALPHVALVNKYKTNMNRPHKIAINCNSSRLAIIDAFGLLSMIELSEHAGQSASSTDNETSKLERKDVWAMCWASDNPQLLAIMEKTRMYVFKGVYPEEPMASSGYICCFQDLEIQAVLLDDIMDNPERPLKDHLICLQVKSLRDTRQLLDKVGINEAAQFIDDNPHPRLWRLLAEAAVKKMNLITAEAAFIRSLDYSGIQFIKRLQEIGCDLLRKATTATYFKQFDDAEKLFLDSDRRDLALNLRQILGDWFRVVQIMKMGIRGTDIQMESTWNSIGNYFYDRRNWEGAREYYEKSRNQEMLIHCYYALEDFDAMESTISALSERHQLLSKIAEMFVSVGLCSAAVAAYTKLGDVYSAVNLCVKLNEWDQAITLAKQNHLPQISDLLAQYATHLIKKNCLGEAVELFLKANRYLEAAKIVHQLADIESKNHVNALKVKQLYVYGALLVEEHVKIINSAFKNQSIVNDATDDLDIIENAWHGAEGYHLLSLVHSYLNDGQLHNAMIAALKLREFDNVIPAEELFCLVAFTSCLNNSFGVCSKAFIKLESLEELTLGQKHEYEKIAVNIFTKHGLKDYHVNRIECPNCETLISDWNSSCSTCFTEFPTCMVTGRPLTDISAIWTCPICKHCSSERDITLQKSCSLCHSLISY